MEYPHLAEQDNSNTTALALADFGAQRAKEGFDVLPCYVGAGWVSEDRFKGALVCALHRMDGTTDRYHKLSATRSDA